MAIVMLVTILLICTNVIVFYRLSFALLLLVDRCQGVRIGEIVHSNGQEHIQQDIYVVEIEVYT